MNTTAVLIPAFMAKLGEYAAVLNTALWEKALSSLEQLMLKEGITEARVEEQLLATMAEAAQATHWEALLELLKGSYEILSQVRDEFCSHCELGVLANFLAGESGLLEARLLETLTGKDPILPEETSQIHLCLSGLTRLAEGDSAWVPVLNQVVELFSGACELRGGDVEALQKRFGGIKARFAPRASQAVQPSVQRAVQVPTTTPSSPKKIVDPNWNGGGQMAQALKGVKVGKKAA